MALIHGAASHQFDRLKFAFDLVQAARRLDGLADLDLLERLVRTTGCGGCLGICAWMLRGLTGERELEILARRLALPGPGFVDRVLMSPRVVAPNTRVILRRARRCGFRHRLKARGAGLADATGAAGVACAASTRGAITR